MAYKIITKENDHTGRSVSIVVLKYSGTAFKMKSSRGPLKSS